MDFSNLFENIGRIIMTIIYFIIFILLLLYFIFGNKKLKSYLTQILKEKVYIGDRNSKEKITRHSKKLFNKEKIKMKKSSPILYQKNRSNSFHNKRMNQKKKLSQINLNNSTPHFERKNVKKFKSYRSEKKIKSIVGLKNIKNEDNKDNKDNSSLIMKLKKSSKILKSNSHKKNIEFKSNTPKKNNNKLYNLSVVPKKKGNINAENKNTVSSIDKMGSQNIIISKNVYIKMNKSRKKKVKNVSQHSSAKNSKDSFMSGKIFKNKLLHQPDSMDKLDKSININFVHFTNHELNTMVYQKALIHDKRTYFEYYWSLVKKKQIILFIIFNNDDYNLITIKTTLFFISFSLYFTLNGFFFNDNTMHKFYENNGEYDFVEQIPILIYSTLVTTVINIILKTLSLSEKNMLEIKHESNIKRAQEKSKEVWSFIKLKVLMFFLLCFLIMAFFWYFISCFCAVYKNTQIILISDTLISFGMSMIYPFAINLIPGIFRIPALRASSKDKECLYKTSVIISLV